MTGHPGLLRMRPRSMLRPAMNDADFAAMIDARFPYGDEGEWKRRVDLGRSISPNAHFVTLSEICRPPAGAVVTADAQRRMVEYWCAGFAHPLKDVVVACALARIDRRPISVAEALRVMDAISHHKGQWGALSIALYACDDVDDIADARFDAIRSAWAQDG